LAFRQFESHVNQAIQFDLAIRHENRCARILAGIAAGKATLDGAALVARQEFNVVAPYTKWYVRTKGRESQAGQGSRQVPSAAGTVRQN
jgi:hypothetical protein